MKLNLKKINYHKWIPSRFSSFQAKLLIAFLVATLLPLTLVALVSYHVSYNLARDRITNSALMSDEQLIFQLNSRLNQTENVADTIQYQMYAFEHSSPDQVGTMQALTSMRSNISLYKSTFDFFHIYVFLKPEQTGADEGIYFFSTDKLFNYGISESELTNVYKQFSSKNVSQSLNSFNQDTVSCAIALCCSVKIDSIHVASCRL